MKGDLVLVIVNNYDEDANLRNGDLGIVVEVFEKPDDDGTVAVIEVNNALINVTAELLEKLHLGYAITIHKSQGSQWPNEADKMIDQTLLYTASTRPSERLVMMGDERVIEKAIKVGSRAINRATFLRERINYCLKIAGVVAENS